MSRALWEGEGRDEEIAARLPLQRLGTVGVGQVRHAG
jgi:hypothetical protein